LASNCATRTIDRAKVTRVVARAIHLARLSVGVVALDRADRQQQATPTSGAKVVRLRRPVIELRPSVEFEQGVGQQAGDAEQHDKRVVVEVAGLQLAGPRPTS
jgi:hypothetical protein